MKRFWWLLTLNFLVLLSAGTAVFVILHNTAIDQVSAQLLTIVESRKATALTISRFNQTHLLTGTYLSRRDILQQFEQVQGHFQGLGATGEFAVAEKQGDLITVIFRQRPSSLKKPAPVFLNVELAEPMKRALEGETGLITTMDYRGERVLAAFAPVEPLNIGLVAQIDLSEVNGPFYQAATYGGLSGLALFLLFSLVFFRRIKPTEETISTTASQFQKAFDHAPHGLALVSLEGRFIRANAALCHMFGYTQKKLEELTFQELTYPDDLAIDLELMHEVLDGKRERYELEKRYFHRLGHVIPALLGVSLVRDPAGQPVHFVSQIQDLSVQKQVEMELMQYKNIVSSSSGMMALVNSNYEYLTVNEAYLKNHNRTRHQILGETMSDIFGEEAFNTKIKAHTVKCLNGYTVNFQDWFDYSDAGRKRMDIHYSPYRGADGEVLGFVISARDITERHKIENRLLTSENQYRRLVEHSPLCIHEVDENGKLSSMNAAGLDMMGVSSEADIIGMDYCEIPKKSDQKRIEILMTDAFKGKPSTFEFSVDASDVATEQYFSSSFIPLEENDGSIKKLMGISENVTERTLSARAIKASEARFQTIAHTIVEMFWITSPDWKDIQYISPAFEKIWGLPVEKLYETPLLWLDSIHPDDSPLIKDILAKRISGEITAPQYPDFRIVRPDGTVRWISTEVFPVENDLGETTSIVGHAQDITEKKEAMQELAQSEARFRTIFDTVGIGTITINANGEIQMMNPAAHQIFGYDEGEFLGQDVGILIPEQEALQRGGFIETYRKNDDNKMGEIGQKIVAKRKNGEEFPLQIEVAELEIDGDIGFVVSFRDLSKIEALEGQIRQMQKTEAIGQLTAGVAHDFNNLLAIILGNLSFLQVDIEEGRAIDVLELEESISAAISAVDRGTELTNRLLSFSRQQVLSPKMLSIDTLVTEMQNLLTRTIPENIQIVWELGAGNWLLRVDASQFENALLNLIINARDAMGNNGILTISTKAVTLDDAFAASHLDVSAGDHILISVNDNGEGIPAEIIDRVFDPFFTTKEVGQGTGLGLSMVYGFVKQSGGYIDISSEPDAGTTVNIYLPREYIESKQPSLTHPKGPVIMGSESILVLEDELEVRKITVRMLTRFGYTVYEAEDGETALLLMEKHPDISLLVSDVILPGKNSGPEVAAIAKERLPHLNVLFMSGYADNAVFLEVPGTEHLILRKPFTADELGGKVQETFGRT